MFKNEIFVTEMNEIEKAAWFNFQAVATNFLGNIKSLQYKKIIA